ncbi:MAG: hypothetical protein JWR80_393 [Bradyrhizobium sp.]|nr:hypothetical protein [Bradyrhizobium sp.]
MVKILTGLVVAIVIAAGGLFGFERIMQHRVAGEVEAAFEQIRAAGGKASHGEVSFDLLTRTVRIADITAESAGQPAFTVKIASFTASAVSQPDATRFAADSIEAADIEVNGAMAAPAGWRVTYKVPRISVKDYSGPVAMQQQPASSSIVDLYRFSLEQLANVSASSVAIPSIATTMNSGTPDGRSGTYSGLSMQGIKAGKIAAMKADGLAFNFSMQQAGKAENLIVNASNTASYDFDASALAAALNPQKADDNQYHRIYRQFSTGAYTVTSDSGLRLRIEGLTVDDVGVRPSRLPIAALMAILPSAGATPTPAQAREMMERMAELYQGIRIGNGEMRGLSMETPQGPVKLAAMRFNLENGKIGEFAFEGLDARSPKGPVKVGRFALRSIDIANLMRMLAQFSDPGRPPSPDQALGMLALLEGVELKGLVAPYKNASRPVSIDTVDLSWGQFVGPIPSRLRLTAKMAAPVDATDPAQTPLVQAGIDMVVLDLDLGAAWTESSRAFVLEPVTIELGSLLKATARLSLASVPRGVFSVNPVQATSMAAQIEAGTLELSLRDLGSIDLALAQLAHAQDISRDAARRNVVDGIRAISA